jgi:alpha-amylase
MGRSARFALLPIWCVFLLLARPATAQVLFQHFYYEIDKPPAGSSWWREAGKELPALARLGVSALWSPVPTKGGSGVLSMGYDPYDLYDLGSKDQKGTVATRFGTREEYLAYVAMAHANGLRVYADVVLNHAGGADQAEPNPIMERLGMDDIADDAKVPLANRPPGYNPATTNLRSWTRFLPVGADGKPGTGRFPRDYRHFHPSAIHPDRDEPYHKPEFGADYCYAAEDGYVGKALCDWGVWFREQTGVDGFRLDAVKLIEPPFLSDFSARVTAAPTASGEPFFLVGEFWDTNHQLLGDFQKATGDRMSLFDFGLFYGLWDMTETPGKFDMRDLLKRRLEDRERAVSFVSNHDVDRSQPIRREKRALPYAITMTMSGRPSIFYKDYFRPEDKRLPVILERLVAVHNRFAVGREIVRYADADVLAIEREGNLLGLFNDGGADGTARMVAVPQTGFGKGTALRSARIIEGATPVNITAGDGGRVTVTVPPAGFVLLVRADATEKTNPDRFPRRPLATTQVTEFADDLDTGRLNATPRSVAVTVAAGSPLVAQLKDTLGSGGDVLVEIRDSSGQMLAAGFGHRGSVPVTARLAKVPVTGVYRIAVTAPGDPTPGHLSVTYTAPAKPL